MCDDKIVITSILQSCALHWDHTHLFHPGIARTEATICHHLYWFFIRDAVWKEVINSDTYKHNFFSKQMVNYQLRVLSK